MASMLRLCLLFSMFMVCIPTEIDYVYPQDYIDDDGDDDIADDEQEIVNLDKPDFVSVGGMIVVQEGAKVVMPCQVNCLGGRQTLWTKSPGVVAEEDQLFVGAIRLADHPRIEVAELSDEGGTIITISSATIPDSGTYTCRIADNRLDQSLVFTLQVAGRHRQEEEAFLRSEAGIAWLAGTTAGKLLLVTAVTLCR
eukprot:GFUD01043257.1.p1 GENE.GFUD01043257.1~~GFUD01043257.1.p1  ORF type:complete len:196 (-),score=70.66 GFUD01043257.1:80-667(-)